MGSSQTKAGEPVRVLFVEDQSAYVDGILVQLRPFAREVVIAGVTNNAEDALRLVEELVPDVILLDLRIYRRRRATEQVHEEHGIELLKRVRQLRSACGVLVLTNLEDQPILLHDAVDEGAAGYVFKDADLPPIELKDAIVKVAKGGKFFHDKADDLRREFNRLTDREKAVLDLMADGLPNEAIASELGIALRTVATYARNIYVKLDLDGRRKVERRRL